MNLVTALIVAGAVGLAATALAALVRVVRGPTILDRMVASDVLLTTVLLAVGVDMVARDHTAGIPIMIAIAATGTLATIVVALYVRRRAVVDPYGEQPGRKRRV